MDLSAQQKWRDRCAGHQVLAASKQDITRFFSARRLHHYRRYPTVGSVLLLTANDQGDIAQWGALVTANETRFVALRTFDVGQPVANSSPSLDVRVFLSVANDGELSLLYSTSGRLLDQRPSSLPASAPMAISPRSNLLIAAPQDGLITAHGLDNKHPEISGAPFGPKFGTRVMKSLSSVGNLLLRTTISSRSFR